MDRSETNYDLYQKAIISNCDYVSKVNALEYVGYPPFSDAIDQVRFQATKRTNFTMLYKPMAIQENDVNADSLLFHVYNISKYFATEADIIARFSIKSRQAMLKALNCLVDCPQNDEWYSNMCEGILSNYVFLSLFSDTPENLVISEKMYHSIDTELALKRVTIDDIKLAIMEGPIKFSEDEIDYIFSYFIEKLGLLKDNYTLSNGNSLLLVRQPMNK